MKTRNALKKAVLELRYKDMDISKLDDLQELQLSFTLTTNSRGLHVINELESHGVCFDNARVLDVGCAYGGFSIEARRRGAKMVYGVDIDPELISLAVTNLSDETEDFRKACKFLICDMTSQNALNPAAGLPQGFFDCIFVNDVFEHIYDTSRLLQIISQLAAPACILYFEIPNGLHYINFVEKEPHSFLYGRSIINPDFSDYPGTYYRRWDYYSALFAHWGFDKITLFNDKCGQDRAGLCIKLREEFARTETRLHNHFSADTSQLAKMIMDRLRECRLEFTYDLDKMSVKELYWKYGVDFWKGIAVLKRDSCHDLRNQYDRLNEQYTALANSKLGKIQLVIWNKRHPYKPP